MDQLNRRIRDHNSKNPTPLKVRQESPNINPSPSRDQIFGTTSGQAQLDSSNVVVYQQVSSAALKPLHNIRMPHAAVVFSSIRGSQ